MSLYILKKCSATVSLGLLRTWGYAPRRAAKATHTGGVIGQKGMRLNAESKRERDAPDSGVA